MFDKKNTPLYPYMDPFHHIKDLKKYTDVDAAMDRIYEIYNHSTQSIRDAFDAFLNRDTQNTEESVPTLDKANYPFVGIKVDAKDLNLDARLSYGVVVEAGVYGGTLTSPQLFDTYYRQQIDLLLKHHKVPIYIGISDWPIPLPFALEHSATFSDPRNADMSQLWQTKSGFVLPNLSRIDDNIANCVPLSSPSPVKPISIFTGERVDFSLHRLHHYTATAPEHFQSFVLLTNYQRYVDEFIEFSIKQLKITGEYVALILPGDIVVTKDNLHEAVAPANLPQMPAYHLKRADGQGITFVNIGVGPSNAKTITDHLAVLRPHCWFMLGHCAGLRSTQVLGDYVLAHGYVREDHVLDQDLPPWIPVPPIAEVQVALQQAVTNISNQKGLELKSGMRTGTVVTTDNRNWELRTAELYERFKQSRAIALDMESATVAANGFRFRVPYGTLLCVSDKPIHGEIKLRGMANIFYRERVTQHLKIGLEAIRLLREQGVDQLHSRKLRGFDEPPFR